MPLGATTVVFLPAHIFRAMCLRPREVIFQTKVTGLYSAQGLSKEGNDSGVCAGYPERNSTQIPEAHYSGSLLSARGHAHPEWEFWTGLAQRCGPGRSSQLPALLAGGGAVSPLLLAGLRQITPRSFCVIYTRKSPCSRRIRDQW